MKKILFFVLMVCNLYTYGQNEVMVLMETNFGNIKLKLYNQTPVHRDNFKKLVETGFYDGLLFHRVIDGFMIQGGDPKSKDCSPDAQLGAGSIGYTLPAEILPDLYHKKGALAAARTGDQMNPQRRSSGSQFYIVQGKVYKNQELTDMVKYGNYGFSDQQIKDYTTIGGTPGLDAQYTVFGEVVEGLDIVDQIAKTPTRQKDNRPTSDVKIIKAKIVTK